MEIFDIFWRPSFPVDWCWKNERYNLIIPDLPDDTPKAGLYQIYGQHPVYGENVLLYIGLSTNWRLRLRQHLDGPYYWKVNLAMSVGTVYTDRDHEPSSKTVEDYKTLHQLESILIATHQPALNKFNKEI